MVVQGLLDREHGRLDPPSWRDQPAFLLALAAKMNPLRVLRSAVSSAAGLLDSASSSPAAASPTPSGDASQQRAQQTQQPRPLRPTAYLDGLRGFAAFLVYWHHHQLWSHVATGDYANFENGWGRNGVYRFAALPFVRNFFTGGHVAVACFFVISGYVLSAKPLALIQAADHGRLADNLASALFRRWFRLYVPVILTTFAWMTSWHVFGFWNLACEPKETWAEDAWLWWVDFKNWSFPFKEGWPWPKANTHLWSISTEMRGSIIIYTVLLALSRATTRARLWCAAGLIVYFMYVADGYYGALFIAGMLHCDMDLLLQRRGEDALPRWIQRLKPYRGFIYLHLLVLAFWLSGVPSLTTEVEDLRESPGWYYVSFLKPQAMYDYKWFFLFWAANIIVFAIPRVPPMRRFFETRFCQYLGRISFALYLVHGPVLAGLGDRIYYAVGFVRTWRPDGGEDMLQSWANLFPLPMGGPMGLEIAFLAPHLILLPLTLWLAELVTRWVDEPAVRLAAWMYRSIQGSDDAPPPKAEEASRMA